MMALCLTCFSCSSKEMMEEKQLEPQAIKTYPTTGVLHFMYGEIYRSMGNINYANVEYRKALEYDTTTTILNAVGDTYAILGKQDDARIYYEQSLFLDSLDLEVKEKISRLYVLDKNYSKALPYLEEIIQTMPEDPALLKAIAEAYRNEGDLENAKANLKKLMAVNSSIPWTYIYYGEILIQEKDNCHAVPYLEKALQLTGDDDQLYMFLLKTVYNCGDEDKVGDVLFRWVSSGTQELDPYLLFLDYHYQKKDAPRMKYALSLLEDRVEESWEIPYYSILYAIMIGREDIARASYEKCIQFDAASEDVYRQMIYFYMENNESEMAFSILDSGIERYGLSESWLALKVLMLHQTTQSNKAIKVLENAAGSGDLTPYMAADLAQLYWKNGYRDKADSLYVTLLIIQPKNSVILNNYAFFLSQSGQRLKEAENYVDRALEIEKKGSYYDTKAWIHYQLGDLKTARKWINKALEIAVPASEEIYYHQGMILQAMKKISLAKSAFTKALQINSEYQPAVTALKEL